MRPRSSLVIPAALCLAAFATTARAQVVTFTNSGSGGAMTHVSTVTLPDDALRGMVAAHESAVLQPNAENNYVVLVVDANDQYVSSRASKMNVMTPASGEGAHVFTVGDSGTARVVLRSTTGEATSVGAAAGAVVIARTGEHGDEGHANGVMGTGINMADVASIGMKRFAAGELASGQLMVTVIKLK